MNLFPFTLVVTVLLWITVAWRAAKVWRKGQDRSLWWAFFGLAVMMTLRMPPGKALDRATGITDLSYLLKYLIGGVLAPSALLAFLRNVSGAKDSPSARRRRVILACLTALILAILFFAKLQPYDTPLIYADPVGRYVLVVYTLLFLGYLTASLLGGIRLCWRWGTKSSGPALGWGLRIVGVGLSAGVGYSVLRAATITTRSLCGRGIFPGLTDDYICTALLMAALVLIVVGTSLPMLSRYRAWRTKRRALLHLRPLWRDLTDATPSVRLHPPHSALAERLNPLKVDDRLYRRCVAIRDTALALANYAPPEMRKRAEEHAEDHGLYGTEAAIAAEACWLAAARRAKLRGAAPTPTEHRPAGGGRDLRSETAALTHLSDAYHRDLVRTFADSEEPLEPTP